jgi:hypothetical protein
LYFLGLSVRNAANKALSFLQKIKNKKSHVSIWKWIQKYKLKRSQKKRKIKEYSSELIWLWVVMEPTDKEILSFQISKE